MKMSFLWLLLLTFASSLPPSHTQNPQGFISLDCGLRDSNGYTDSNTGIFYTTDEAYVETGESKSISAELKTNSVRPQFFNVRSFPGPNGTRSCYTLMPLHGKGTQVLLRVSFMYGNYDELNRVPEFDLYVEVNLWETVMFKDSSSQFTTEILHIPTSDYLHVCLVNTGKGTPFMSLLELRSTDPLNPAYNTTSGSLKSLVRWDIGSTSNNFLRYKDDLYDRIWTPLTLPNTTTLRSNETTIDPDTFIIPSTVMSTAAMTSTRNTSIIFSFGPNNPTDQVYMYFHYAELVPNQARQYNIYVNDDLFYGPVIPTYLTSGTIYSTGPDTSPNYTVKLSATENSKLPATLNAFEAYTVKYFLFSETNEKDVSAIMGVKAMYNITRNWQGDPCSPRILIWIGINCFYIDNDLVDPPSIISLNLSSSGLVGSIAPSISNLTMLQSLDLSNNSLTGEVPEFLAWLPSLRFLGLRGNNFGSLPPLLKEKADNGSLTITLGPDTPLPAPDKTFSCQDDGSCSKKKRITFVPIIASVIGSFVAIVALSALMYRIIKRRKQAAPKVQGEATAYDNPIQTKKVKDDNYIGQKVTRFQFSEITSCIRGSQIIGRGGFGTVYHGCMNGVEVAVKVFNDSQELRNKDFMSEVKILATVYHKNLTRILGYCDEGINKAIIFELMGNGNLNDHLSLDKSRNILSWKRRLSILVGAAEGLEYLHHGCRPPIIHRDIKPENILLTMDFEAKLADFGFSRIFPFQSSTIVGTFGYHDPQYDETSKMTEKLDIYSFGVLILVVVTGQRAILQGSTTHITQWISNYVKNGDIRNIVDLRLEGNYNVNVAWRVVELGLACVATDSSRRPNMHYVVKELKECLPKSQAPFEQYEDDSTDVIIPSSNFTGGIMPTIR